MSKKTQLNWIFPGISLFMFATLLAALLYETTAFSMGTLISYSSGLLAYTMMLTVTFMGSRPRMIEKHLGMPVMYEVHALMSVVLSLLVLVHIGLQWNGLAGLMSMSLISKTGWIGTISLILVMFSGIFSLSGIFVNYFHTLRKWKEDIFNRELNLWIHRLAIVAVLAIYFHMYYLPFLKDNTVFMLLLNVYTFFVLGFYAYWKLKIVTSPKYEVVKIYRGTPSLWVLEFKPVEGTVMQYREGDYFFIRFPDADITREGHPFSTSSAITRRYSNTIEFMIKEAGDWTESLANIKEGDIATLEGPYGNFMPDVARDNTDIPYILLGGGIGLTPNLSIARHEIEKNTNRKIFLVWGLAFEEDMFMLDELEEMKEANPNFSYHIIFSNEEVEGYPFGYISDEFMTEIGATQYYRDAHFFVCGPPPMLDATRQMLDDAHIPDDHIHLDDFGF